VDWRTGLSGVPPDSVRCIRTIQGSTSHSRENAGTLRYNSPDCPVSQRSNDYLRATVDSDSGIVKRRSQSSESEGHRTVRCTTRLSVPQEDKGANGQLLQNPNGWVTWRRTGQRTVPVRWCTGLSRAPIASSLPNGYGSGWGL
jgi:hypothetical protein